MAAVMWLFMWIRDQLWAEIHERGEAGQTPRSQATLDLIHIINEIIAWAERSHYGESGEILPIASLERQAFYDILNSAVTRSMMYLAEWDQWTTDEIRRAVHAHVISLDTVATMTLRPYYTSKLFELAKLVPNDSEGTDDGTGDRSTVADDGRERGHDSTGD